VWELASERGLALLHEHCVRPLDELRVALLRGCQLLRPSRDLGAAEADLLVPLGRVIAACGALEVPIESGSSCCGAAGALTRPEIALGAAAAPLAEAIDADAEALVVASSRCYAMLRDRREQIARHADRELSVPVLHVAQLVALAFGLRGGELQLDRVSAGARAVTERLAGV
jgi:succinate dehydrogenase / fumarate reductase, cytochrome b subunit